MMTMRIGVLIAISIGLTLGYVIFTHILKLEEKVIVE